jgi:hypothetical protein
MTGPLEPTPRPYTPSPGARVFAWLLIVLGGAWTLLSGGCTLMFLSMPFGGGGGADAWSGVAVFLAIGAVCILPGLGLLYGGWVILRKPKRPR